MIYIYVAVGLIICQLISVYKKNKIKHFGSILFISFSIILFLISATRENVGLDYASYKTVFYTAKELMKNNSIQIAYSKLCAAYSTEPFYLILNMIMPDFHTLMFLMAFLGVGIKCFCIGKYCQNRFFCLYLYFTDYFLYYDMGVIRQGVAFSFMLLALICIEQKKHVFFWLSIAVGLLFHIITVMMIPFYFIANKNIKIKHMIIGICLSIPFVFLSLKNVVLFFVDILGDTRLSLKLTSYFTNTNRPFGAILKAIVIFFMFLLIYQKMEIKSSKANLFLKCNWYGIIFLLLFSFNSFFAGRGTKFFIFSEVFIMDEILYHNPKGKYSLLTFGFYTVVFFRTLLLILPGSIGNGFQSYVPYNSYLF